MQATSQALQPMQVVVSISLATCSWRCVPSPGGAPEWPEIFWMRRLDMAQTLLQLHQEALELGRVGVGIGNRGRKHIGAVQRGLAFILGNAPIAPVNGDADLVGLLAVARSSA